MRPFELFFYSFLLVLLLLVEFFMLAGLVQFVVSEIVVVSEFVVLGGADVAIMATVVIDLF